MPAKRLSMRKIKEVLRLKFSGLSNRKIAAAVSVSRPTVNGQLN
jgi:ATP/maltotriose-dependent transcriptional regulator MalT